MSNADYLRALRQIAVAEGKCYQCRFRPQKPGRRSCQSCIDRSKEFERSIRYKRCTHCCCNLPRGWEIQLCPGCRDDSNAKGRAKTQARLAANRCSTCGAPKPKKRRQCLTCAEHHRVRQLEWQRLHGRGVKLGSCSTCTALGLVGINHDRRTHDRYMARAQAWAPTLPATTSNGTGLHPGLRTPHPPARRDVVAGLSRGNRG